MAIPGAVGNTSWVDGGQGRESLGKRKFLEDNTHWDVLRALSQGNGNLGCHIQAV